MLKFLWLVPAIPFGSALILATLASRWPRKAAAVLGTGAIAASSAISLLIAVEFLRNPPSGTAFTQMLWTWFDVAGFRPEIALYLDALSLIMMAVVTFVAFLIHLYSTEFMAG